MPSSSWSTRLMLQPVKTARLCSSCAAVIKAKPVGGSPYFMEEGYRCAHCGDMYKTYEFFVTGFGDGELVKFNRKPQTIEAIQWDGSQKSGEKFTRWISSYKRAYFCLFVDDEDGTRFARVCMDCDTMSIDPGEYIARDQDGNFFVMDGLELMAGWDEA
jgi:hypothetical protein